MVLSGLIDSILARVEACAEEDARNQGPGAIKGNLSEKIMRSYIVRDTRLHICQRRYLEHHRQSVDCGGEVT